MKAQRARMGGFTLKHGYEKKRDRSMERKSAEAIENTRFRGYD